MKTLLRMLGAMVLGIATIPNFNNLCFDINQNKQSQPLEIQNLNDVLTYRNLRNIYVGQADNQQLNKLSLNW